MSKLMGIESVLEKPRAFRVGLVNEAMPLRIRMVFLCKEYPLTYSGYPLNCTKFITNRKKYIR